MMLGDPHCSPDSLKIVASTIKEMKRTASSPAKLWTCLETLRTAIPTSILEFPDPCASSKLLRSTRHVTFVTESFQLIPVIVSLVELSLQLPSVRAEISRGCSDGKEETKEYHTKVTEEKDSWNEIKQALLDTRHESETSPNWDLENWQKEVNHVCLHCAS
jgi:hypothetical protein